MMHRSLLSFASCFVAICLIGSTRPCEAAIIVGSNFIEIDDAGNPSDGLQYLKVSLTGGFTLPDAIANGVANGFAGARAATPAEFDDLFAAAGITYNFALTAADGFEAGGGLAFFISSGANYDGGLLSSQLGINLSGQFTRIWTDPDGSAAFTTTRDVLLLTPFEASIRNDASVQDPPPALPDPTYSWLLVNDSASAVPEPSSALLLGFASLIGIATYRRKKLG